MLRRLYEWTMSLARSRHAIWAMGGVSFAESSFFPIPPDVLLVPMILANPERARFYALWCTVTSVLGGIVGYAIGALLYDSIGLWLISIYGYQEHMEQFRASYAHWGAAIILLKGLTPIPYKLVTIASGFAGYNIYEFIILSFITRGVRFFLTGELLLRYGEQVRLFIEKRLGAVTLIILGVVVGGFIMARYAI